MKQVVMLWLFLLLAHNQAYARKKAPRLTTQQILQHALRALGGRDQRQTLRTLRAEGTMQIPTPAGWKNASLRLFRHQTKGLQRTEMTLGGRTMLQILTPTQGWLQQQGQWFPMPKALWLAALAEQARTGWLWKAFQKKGKLRYLGRFRRGSKQVLRLVWTDRQKRRTWFELDSKTFRLQRRSYMALAPQGTGKVRYTTLFRKYRFFRGSGSLRLLFATEVENYVGKQKVSMLRLQRVFLNPRFHRGLFQRSSPVD